MNGETALVLGENETSVLSFQGVAYSPTEGFIMSGLPNVVIENSFQALENDVMREEAEGCLHWIQEEGVELFQVCNKPIILEC